MNPFFSPRLHSMIVHFVGWNTKHIVQKRTSGFVEMVLVTINTASVPASIMFLVLLCQKAVMMKAFLMIVMYIYRKLIRMK